MSQLPLAMTKGCAHRQRPGAGWRPVRPGRPWWLRRNKRPEVHPPLGELPLGRAPTLTWPERARRRACKDGWTMGLATVKVDQAIGGQSVAAGRQPGERDSGDDQGNMERTHA